MKLSTKGRYAMIALTDLAAQGPDAAGVAERDRRAAGHQPRLSRAALRQAAAGGDRRIRCAARAAATGWRGRSSEIRISEILAAVDETMDALARGAGASGGAGGTARAAAGGQALGAALGQRLRDAAPDPARRRGEEPARALPGGAGFVAVVDEEAQLQAADERAGLSRLERDGAAPARGAGGDGGGDGRRRQPVVGACRGPGGAGDRRAGAGAGRRGDRLRARARWSSPPARPRRRRWRWPGGACVGAAVEHDCVAAWVEASLPVDADGRVDGGGPRRERAAGGELRDRGAAGAAARARLRRRGAGGRARSPSPSTGAGRGRRSSRRHKLGGPKGVGALLLAPGAEAAPVLRGGGQELGRRAGTENVDRHRRLRRGGRRRRRPSWPTAPGRRSPRFRNILEEALASAAPELIFVGKGAPRLPNTSAFAVPGWKGETQVMQMDLAGFAVSAGSACSSGKVRASRVLTRDGLRARGRGERDPGVDRAGDDARRGARLRGGLGATLSPVPRAGPPERREEEEGTRWPHSTRSACARASTRRRWTPCARSASATSTASPATSRPSTRRRG